MGLVYVVGFCTTDFPDGTTGSVPGAWAWAPLARTNDPTNANRTHRNNVFIRLPLWTQRTVTWLSDRTAGHLLPSRTNLRSFASLSRYGQTGSTRMPLRPRDVGSRCEVAAGEPSSLRCSRDHGAAGPTSLG